MIKEIFYDNRTDQTIEKSVYELIETALTTALEAFEFDCGYQVSVSFVNEAEIKNLNREYRNKDTVTDVLSFPLEETDPRGVSLLGDIVICCDKAKAQALEFNHSFEREVAYLSVHSVLHLLGYDHEEDDDKSEMRIAEKEIMKTLGIFKGER